MATVGFLGFCCRRRRGAQPEEGEVTAAEEQEEPPALQLSSYEFSRRGQHHRDAAAKGPDAPRPSAKWDSAGLQLWPPGVAGERGSHVAEVLWEHVSGVYASLRTKEGTGLSFEVGLETRGGDVDYAYLCGPINEASGRFLEFLQTVKSERLKEGRAPGFVFSRWAVVFFRHGITSNRLRVALGWTSIILEVVFAICFLSQLQRMMASRESKLLQELTKISRSLGGFGGIGTLAVLVQHCVVFLFVVRSIFSTLFAALRSLKALERAAKKAHKTVKKKVNTMSTSKRSGMPGSSDASRTSPSQTAGGGDLRQRKRAE